MLLTTSGTLLDAVDDALVADKFKLVPVLVGATVVALSFSGVTLFCCLSRKALELLVLVMLRLFFWVFGDNIDSWIILRLLDL